MTGQQIISAEDLDALPPGSVVLDSDGHAWQRHELWPHPVWICAIVDGPESASDELVRRFSPLTLVYVPMSESSGQDLVDVAAAVVETYEPAGQAIWWRAWAQHPERRAGMEAGVLGAWSGNHDLQASAKPPPDLAEGVDREALVRAGVEQDREPSAVPFGSLREFAEAFNRYADDRAPNCFQPRPSIDALTARLLVGFLATLGIEVTHG